ncbi:MAG: DUF2179 domain-containing protein [Bacteroidetes bacterium]|nr:DUF2179 domain-containing protein [Bacteroidota bacterium]
MTASANFLDSEIFRWVILPLLIFIARMSDVTLGTLRNVFISKGMRNVVPILGFFEVSIWLISMRQIMQHLENPLCFIAFAGGFAMGTYVGLFVEKRLAIGMQVLRIIINQDAQPLIDMLQRANFGVTIMDGHGAKGPVKIIFTIIKRRDLEYVRRLIHDTNPNAFYSIEDVKVASQGVFPNAASSGTLNYIRNIFPDLKEK